MGKSSVESLSLFFWAVLARRLFCCFDPGWLAGPAGRGNSMRQRFSWDIVGLGDSPDQEIREPELNLDNAGLGDLPAAEMEEGAASGEEPAEAPASSLANAVVDPLLALLLPSDDEMGSTNQARFVLQSEKPNAI